MSIQDYKDKKVLNERLMKNNWAVLSVFSCFAKKKNEAHVHFMSARACIKVWIIT